MPAPSGKTTIVGSLSSRLGELGIAIYVIDVAEGEKIPRKGGPGITRFDLLVMNKIDLAPAGVAWRILSVSASMTPGFALLRFYEFEER